MPDALHGAVQRPHQCRGTLSHLTVARQAWGPPQCHPSPVTIWAACR